MYDHCCGSDIQSGARGLGIEDDLVRLAEFHKPAMLHDINGIGNVIRQANVVGDEDNGHADLIAQL